MCESEGVKPYGVMKVKMIFGSSRWQSARSPHRPAFYIEEVRGRACTIGPERWRTIHAQNEARGNSGGGSKRY